MKALLNMRLEGKTAIVTGAGRGIGKAIAMALAAEGARVMIPDVVAANAQATADEISSHGGIAEAMAMDMADPKQIEQMVEQTMSSFGRIDILVNNAGIAFVKPFLDTTLEEWEKTLQVNLTGVFLCSQAVIRKMLAADRPGRIINIASLSGQKGGYGRTSYGVSKAGVEVLTKILAVEFGGKGINVNAIAPGPIDTAMSRKGHSQATRDAYHRLIPMKRYGAESEIADAAVFLASDESSYVCGHTLNVDGGFLAAGLMED
jgi:3-oxoacyl-[acyl-carrier protein] reductase